MPSFALFGASGQTGSPIARALADAGERYRVVARNGGALDPDIGPIALALSREPRAYGKAWHFDGSGVVTQREFAERIFAKAGSDPKFLVAIKTMLRMLGLFNPLMRELVEMNYLQTHPVIMDDTALHELLPNVQATAYEDGIDRTLAAMSTVAAAS